MTPPTIRAAILGGVAILVAAAVFPPAAGAGPYAPSGQPVTGGNDAGAAVALAPGVYTDTLAQGAASAADTGSVRYFAITLRSGQTPYVAATLAPPADPPTEGTLGVEVTLTARGETSSCEQDSATDFASDDRLDPVTAVAAPGRAGAEDGCPAGTLLVRVERSGDALVDEALNVEIAYRLEPAAAATTGLPSAAGTGQPSLQPNLTGTPATLASGHNFTDAPVVGTGIYRDALTAGDTRIVRVHLDWGQRFAYSFASAAKSGVTSDDSLNATTQIRNPLRQAVAQADGARTSAIGVGESESTLSGATLAPVRYLNRTSDDDDVAGYADAGDYYLVLASDVPQTGDDSVSYPYSLQIEVFGTPQPAPVYAGASTSAASSGTASSNGGTGIVVAGVAGGVVLVLVAVLVVVLSRRRGTRQLRTHT